MTYIEAAEYRDKNIELVGKHSDFLKHTVQCLIIAPDDIALPDFINVYKETMGDAGNELALQNLGFSNGNMAVYVAWEAANGQVEQMPLTAYLMAVGQK